MSGRQQIDRRTVRPSGAHGWRAHTVRSGDASIQVRQEVVYRLRQQVATGEYRPPTDELVDRLVGLILARQAGRRPEAGE